jgi:hypothetical protein
MLEDCQLVDGVAILLEIDDLLLGDAGLAIESRKVLVIGMG